MKRKTLSFLVVALITVTACMAAQVNAASQEVQKQNLRSVQAQASVSQAIPVVLPTQAEIVMKGGGKRDGRVVQIDEKAQKLWIQGAVEKRSLPLSQIDKIVFSKSAVVYLSSNGGPVVRGDGTPAKGRPETWRGIPMNAFRLLDPNKGQADVKGSAFLVDKLDSLNSVIVGNRENKPQYVVDEMQFNVQKKTMTIVATPY